MLEAMPTTRSSALASFLAVAPCTLLSLCVVSLGIGACSSDDGGAAEDARIGTDGGVDAGVTPDAGEQAPGRTFEDEALGGCPADARCYGNITVEDVAVSGITTRAVRVHDTSTTEQARVLFLKGNSPARRFQFDVLLRSASEATIIAIHGAGATEDTGTWRFMMYPQTPGSTTAIVQVYDGAWTTLGTVNGLHDSEKWSRVTVEASNTLASFIVGDQRFTTTRKAATASSITSLEIASSGTVSTGTDTYVDNLVMEDTGFLLATETGGREARFPDIVRLKDGRLLAVYQSALAHTGTAANSSSIKMTFSSDNGKTWTTPTVAVDTSDDDRDPKVAVLADGTVLLNWFIDLWSGASTYTNKGLFVARMVAGTDSFGPAIHVPTPAGTGYSHGSVVQVADGDIILPYYNNGAWVIRSHDGGLTWDTATLQQVVVSPTTRYQEPNMALLPSGEIVMLIRTANSSGTEIASTLTRSQDSGLTWSPIETIDFVTSSHHLLTTSSGNVLLTYGDSELTNRPTYGTMISEPSGPWTGTAKKLIYTSGYSDQANPSSVELAPGKYLTLVFNVGTAQLLGFVTTDDSYAP